MAIRGAFLLALAALFVTSLAWAGPAEKFTTKYDNVKIEEVLKNERLMNNAFKCLMDEGRCSPDVQELKKALPDALQNNCSKCSERQREGARKALKYLIEIRKEHFDKLEKKYDPTGVYRKKYRAQAEQEGIKV